LVKRRTKASMTMFPGPVSNPDTSFGLAPAGISVTLAMPPMFKATVPCRASRSSR